MFRNKTKNQGFTLIELLVVISIISLLSSMIFSSMSSARASARDAKRKGDIEGLSKALYLDFINNNGKMGCHGGRNNYDKSTNSGFLNFLVTHGIIAGPPKDPLNVGDYTYNYLTFHAVGSTRCGEFAYIDYTTEKPITECVASGVLVGNNHCHVFIPERPPCPNRSNNWADDISRCNTTDNANKTDY